MLVLINLEDLLALNLVDETSQVVSELGYLNRRNPEEGDVEGAVSNKASQVEGQEVKVETYNTEETLTSAWLMLAEGACEASAQTEGGHMSRTSRTPFPSPVLPNLWVKGQRPDQEVDPANDLVDDGQGAAVDDHEADPGDTRTQDTSETG